MTQETERIAKLEANELNMSKEISEIKQNVKEIKSDIESLKVTIARYAGGITVSWVVIEIGLNYFFK